MVHWNVNPTQLLSKSIQTSVATDVVITITDISLPTMSRVQGVYISADDATMISDPDVVQSKIDSAVFVTTRSVFPAGQNIVLTTYATPQYVAARRSFQTLTPVIALSVITAVAMIGSSCSIGQTLCLQRVPLVCSESYTPSVSSDNLDRWRRRYSNLLLLAPTRNPARHVQQVSSSSSP